MNFLQGQNLCVCVLYPMPGSCTLIGRERSREQVYDVPYTNESRDPQKQYPYCLSCALIGYRPCRPYVLLKTTTKKKDILLLRIALINKHCKHAINRNEAVTEHF